MGDVGRMKYPILYEATETDFFHLGLGPLTNAVKAIVTEERNGNFILEVTVLIEDTIFPNIQENQILKVDSGHFLKDQQFRIKRIVPNHSGKAEIYAEHISYLASEMALKPEMTLHNLTGQQALESWSNGLIGEHPFVVQSDIETVHSTSWRIDKVQNARQALGGVKGSILDTWGGEYQFDNYHISLLKKRGKPANAVLAYGRNITDFEQEKNITNTYTSLYPFAVIQEEQQEKILTIPGYIVDASNWNKFPNRKVLPVDFSSEFNGQEKNPTPSELRKLAEQYIRNNEIGQPKTSIRVSFLDLSKSVDYKEYAPLEEINLCDEVTVIYPKLGIHTVAKVVRTVWNVLDESYDEIEIGEKRASLSTILQQQEIAIQEAVTQSGMALSSADGSKTIFHGLFGENGLGEPKATKVGDVWFKPNGNEIEMYVWNGTIWQETLGKDKLQELEKEFKQQQSELEKVKQSIVETNSKAQQALIDAGFAKNGLSAVEKQTTEALKQAEEAYDHFLATNASITELKWTTSQVEKVTNQLTGELSQKVSQTTFDQLKGTVKNQEALLNQTAKGLEAKASLTIVNTLNNLVNQHTSDLRIQGNKLSSLVTETDGVKVKLSQLEQTSAGFQQTVLDQIKGVTSQQTQLADQYTSVIETIGGLNGKTKNINAGWEIGSINRNGELFDFPTTVRSTKFIEVKAGKPYMVVDGQGNLMTSTMVFYDENKQLVAYNSNRTVSTAMGGSRYLKVVVPNREQPLNAIDYAVIQSAQPQKVDIPIRSQLLQMSDRFNITVQKGDVIGQLNIEAGQTLIQNKQLVLDAETTILTGKAFIPMAMIKDLRVDAATIYGTLDASKVRTINLDAANLSSGYINNDRLRSRSITADKLAVNAIQVGFNNYSQNLQLDPTALSFYSETQLSGKLTSGGMEFWHGTRKIGRMGENYKVGNNNIRGIAMDLEYTGDYIVWSYQKEANADTYTSMMLLDPKGKFTGKSGIHMDADVYLSRIKPNYTNAKEFLEFSTVGFNNNSYSGLFNASRKSGIFMGSSWLYLLHNGSAIPVEDIQKVIYTLKGLGNVCIPIRIASDGTVKEWTPLTL